MGTYKSFDKNKCMYFLKKEEKVFDKYNEIWESVSNIVKKIIVNLYTIMSKYLKTEGKINTNEGFQCFYASNIIQISVILIDSVYRKDENCYAKVILKKYDAFW